MVLNAVVTMEERWFRIRHKRRLKRLSHEIGASGRSHGKPHDASCIDVHGGCDTDILSLPIEMGEICCPCVVCVCRNDLHEEIWVFHGLDSRLLPPSSSSPVCLDTEEFHHSLHWFLVSLQCKRHSSKSV